jgi:hypothetical protein
MVYLKECGWRSKGSPDVIPGVAAVMTLCHKPDKKNHFKSEMVFYKDDFLGLLFLL